MPYFGFNAELDRWEYKDDGKVIFTGESLGEEEIEFWKNYAEKVTLRRKAYGRPRSNRNVDYDP